MRIRKKYLFYTLAFASAIIGAIVATIDTVISSEFIPDPWALGFACFIVGVPISLIFCLFFSIPTPNKKSIGAKIIDPSFKRLRLIKRIELPYHLLAGLGNAILTIGYFMLLSMLKDPSVVLPFSQIVILYLLIFESITEKNIPTLIEVQSSVIVTFGAILGSISLIGTINPLSMIIVFLVINPAWVLFSIYQRKLKLLRINEKPNDSLNIRFWNVIFACFFTAIIVKLYDFITGNQYFNAGITAALTHFNWVALTMSFTFFSYVFYIRALGIGKASVTQAIRASTIIFAIPLSILLSILGIIEPFSVNPLMWLIKTIGITLILLGIVSFALTLVKAYIFINIKPNHSIEETMQKLWNIKGVTRVCATTGPYDIMVKIYTRTLVTGYERIIRKVEEIDAIKEYKWESVLKEWEEI